MEDQITKFVQKYFDDTGYTAENLGSNKIYERDGRVALELDGLILAESDVNEPSAPDCIKSLTTAGSSSSEPFLLVKHAASRGVRLKVSLTSTGTPAESKIWEMCNRPCAAAQ